MTRLFLILSSCCIVLMPLAAVAQTEDPPPDDSSGGFYLTLEAMGEMFDANCGCAEPTDEPAAEETDDIEKYPFGKCRRLLNLVRKVFRLANAFGRTDVTGAEMKAFIKEKSKEYRACKKNGKGDKGGDESSSSDED